MGSTGPSSIVRRTSQAGPKPSAHGFDPQTHAAHTPHRRAPPHHLRHTHTPSKPWATRPHECMRRLASHVTPSSAHTHAPAMRPASHFSATRRPEPLAPRNCGSSARGDRHDAALQSRHTHTDSSRRHPTAMGPAQAAATQAIPEPSLARSRPQSASHQHASHQRHKLTQSRLIKALSRVHLQPALRLVHEGAVHAHGAHMHLHAGHRAAQRRLIRSSVLFTRTPPAVALTTV